MMQNTKGPPFSSSFLFCFASLSFVHSQHLIEEEVQCSNHPDISRVLLAGVNTLDTINEEPLFTELGVQNEMLAQVPGHPPEPEGPPAELEVAQGSDHSTLHHEDVTEDSK